MEPLGLRHLAEEIGFSFDGVFLWKTLVVQHIWALV